MNCRILAIVLCVAFVGCAMPHPMGLTTDQWNALAPEKQAEIQAQQYAIDAELRQQREAQRAEQERIAHERAVIRAEQIRQAYSEAGYGDVVTVVIQGGTIPWGGKPHTYEPVSFDLVKGETKRIDFQGRDIRALLGRVDVRLSEDGNMIYFDEDSSERVVLANRDWERGQSYAPPTGGRNSHTARPGMTFFVKYKRLPGAPDKLIIETDRMGQDRRSQGRH